MECWHIRNAKMVQGERNAKENLLSFHCRAAALLRFGFAKIAQKDGINKRICQ